MEKVDCYKFKHNKHRFVTTKTLISLILIAYVICISIGLIYILQSYIYISTILASLIFLIFSLVYFYILKELSMNSIKRVIEDLTYGFLGVNEIYSECYMEPYENYMKIYNKNIEHRIYYDKIKKLDISKNFISFIINEDLIVIPVYEDRENASIERLNEKLLKLK
ncbi:TPA: hypothetical protein K8N36_003168 [Clostridium perfringens]|uniref:hypothetical protein n=1 Tax=Clostridium perfringens TaxID=1502 RepID=UPI001A278782|nr:hypothetical protein [Clostridium perfringens]EJT5926325.1 hypothetical protein [Clostridium perfringens]UBK62075.1 hypothetical protein KLF23_14025 [Clostridium perfringens]HAT4137390.1 hypothetical protein [Clostridium perfringens]HBI6884372.1 hypothetical protein [Clostridium perfringens]HBI6893328.1 hypothetical protein [Clostridium perfringens]